MNEWIFVCASPELTEGARRCVDVGSRKAVVVRLGGDLYALDTECPHRGADLSLGDLDGFHLYCPLHAWSFDLRSGWAFFPEGTDTVVYPVREIEGRIEVSTSGQRPSLQTWRPPGVTDR